MRRWQWVTIVAVLVVAVLWVGALVATVPTTPADLARPAPLAAPDSFRSQPVWAQGAVVHVGRRAVDVGTWVVRELRASAYGVFVAVARKQSGSEGSEDWRFLDARGLHRLPGDVRTAPVVSPDGRYAGWVDRSGPRGLAGRIAQVVVVDLRTGKVVLTDHEGMGGSLGDDLGDRYEELPPRVVGFDPTWAYWVDATGSGTPRRARLHGDHTSQVTARTSPAVALVGVPGVVERGVFRLDGGESGYLSPMARWTFVASYDQLRIWNARTREPVPVRFGGKAVRFGGWTGPRRFLAVVTAQRREGVDPVGDRRRARIVSCVLPRGACTDLARVTGPDSVVLGVPIQP